MRTRSDHAYLLTALFVIAVLALALLFLGLNELGSRRGADSVAVSLPADQIDHQLDLSCQPASTNPEHPVWNSCKHI